MKVRTALSERGGRSVVACLLWGLSGAWSFAWSQSMDTMTWESVAQCTSVREVEFYIRSFPDGEHAEEARSCLTALADREVRIRFNDGCDGCPDLVLVPAGRYEMGSKRGEGGRHKREGPAHEVEIRRPIAVGIHEVTRGEFHRFVNEEAYEIEHSCWTLDPKTGSWDPREPQRKGFFWENPGYEQADDHPVVCVDWDAATAYLDWLSRRSGATYRMLSESEWEYVARAKTDTPRYWGRSYKKTQCRYENGLDSAFAKRYPSLKRKWKWKPIPCNDEHVHTAPVGSFKPNDFGLHDMLGNVREWVADCWHPDYEGAPADGSVWTRKGKGNCARRVLRGGSWANVPKNMRAATRISYIREARSDVLGFRVARELYWGE